MTNVCYSHNRFSSHILGRHVTISGDQFLSSPSPSPNTPIERFLDLTFTYLVDLESILLGNSPVLLEVATPPMC